MKKKNAMRKAKLIIKENGCISGESDTAALAELYLHRDRYTSKMNKPPFCG